MVTLDRQSEDEARLQFAYFTHETPRPDAEQQSDAAFLTTEDGAILTTDDGEPLLVDVDEVPIEEPSSFGQGSFGFGAFGTLENTTAATDQFEFDLYAPFSPGETQRAAREAAARLRELDVDTERTGFANSDVGSNNPPPEFFIGVEQKREVYDALDTIAQLQASDRNNRQALARAGGIIFNFAQKVLTYIGTKFDKAIDAFAVKTGENLADPVKMAAAWTILSGGFMQLALMVKDALGF